MNHAHIVDLEEDVVASSPPSSSPVALTPPVHPKDAYEETALTSALGNYCYGLGCASTLGKDEQLCDSDLPSGSPDQLNDLNALACSDTQQILSLQQSLHASGALFAHPSNSALAQKVSDHLSARDSRSRKRAACCSETIFRPECDDLSKKRKLSKRISHKSSARCAPRLSGAFQLRYARGPGSLRRAESLRTEPPTTDDLKFLTQAIRAAARSPRPQQSFADDEPQNLPIDLGSIGDPFDGNVPTVPTTPTTPSLQLEDTAVPSKRSSQQSPDRFDVPIIAPPPFESIPIAAFSKEEASEWRLKGLLAREREERDADGLIPVITPKMKRHLTEDEEEAFLMGHASTFVDEEEVEAMVSAEEPLALKNHSPDSRDLCRAPMLKVTPELDIDECLRDQILQWFLDVMHPEDENTTYYSPGDLYDLLSTSHETRFHAAYLFMRYLVRVNSAASRSDSVDTASISSEDQHVLDTMMWDVALACMALSVKFHRDCLYPLEVICALEFIELATHELEFEDLENAQRNVLGVLAYRVGSATPGAFMEELWLALPILRRLVSFEKGWEEVQEEAWVVLYDALQHPELLQYPVSLITGVAVIEGVVDVLLRRYQITGVDGRGKRIVKRDSRSLREKVMKASRGVRLDIQDVLAISNDELRACQRWLGLSVE